MNFFTKNKNSVGMGISIRNRGHIDFGDKCFSDVGARSSCKKIEDVGDENDQNRHQHLNVVANTFRLQNPSPTSM